MNGIGTKRALLRHLALVSAFGATASTAAASWNIKYCDGTNGNNETTVNYATCDGPNTVDCWEDPTHIPPQWETGKTYARGQVRVCTGTQQIRVYAFKPLEEKMRELGGDRYYALNEAIDWAGNSAGSISDASANGKWSGWVTVAGAVKIRVTANVWHT